MNATPTTNGHAPGALQLELRPETHAFLRELVAEVASHLKPPARRYAEAVTEFVAAHLGVPEADQARLARRFPDWASNFVLVAVQKVLDTAPYRVHETLDFDANGRDVPTFRSVSIGPDERVEVLEEGWYAAYVGDVPLVVHVEMVHMGEAQLRIRAATPAAHKDVASEFLQHVVDYPNFYKQQVITIDDDGGPSFLKVPEVGIEDVVLDPQLWDEIELQIIDFVGMQSAFRVAGLPFRRGVILAGPPGVGKTLVFRALTHRLAGTCTVLWLTARAIRGPESVAHVFELARSLAPTLMFWEDLDLTVRDRELGGGAATLGELLAQLDGAASSEGIIVCASTNDPSVLDEALSARPSRFDRILHVGPPADEARLRMLERFVAGIPRVDVDLEWVAGQSDGMTGADLRELVITSFADAQRGRADPDEIATLRTEHFAQALSQLTRASAAARRSGVRRKRRNSFDQWGF